MKFSVRQVLASACGAVIAAIIASAFGVKGTIIGVAIGSAAATLGTAFVAQSIERGQEAVKQVVVRAPDTAPLLRKLGSTVPSGGSASSVRPSSSPTEVTGASSRQGVSGGGEGGAEWPKGREGAGGLGEEARAKTMSSPTVEAAAASRRLEITAAADAPEGERLRAATLPARPGIRRFSWRAMAGTAAVVFLLALGFITAIELISGKPLSDIFGGAVSGTSLNNVFNPSSPPATTSTTTTTTTPASTTTTTTAPPGTTTTTTTAAPGVNGTTSTSAPTATTTTSSPGVSATTTTTSGSATSP